MCVCVCVWVHLYDSVCVCVCECVAVRSLQKHLAYFNHIRILGCLSCIIVTKEFCYQIGFIETSLRSFFFS